MSTGRAAHSATLLANGTVLVAGGASLLEGNAIAPALSTAELFDPAADNGQGGWAPTASMIEPRGGHSATVLDGPACRPGAALPAPLPPWCGAVLVAGGTPTDDYHASTATSEVYIPAPNLRSLTPAGGPLGGGAAVTIDGSGFTGATTVDFGDSPAVIVSQTSSRILVRIPAHPVGAVTVTVNAAGGSSLTADSNPGAVFNYEDTPGAVGALQAHATSDHAVTLSFTAAAASTDPTAPPVTRYVIRQSATPITDTNFGVATTLCPGPDGACVLALASVGAPLQINVGGLTPGVTYWFAVAALNDAGLTGPVVATLVTTPAAGCAPGMAPPPAGPGQVTFGAGYSLVGLPAGTVVDAGSSLYGWTDAGAGAAYQVLAGSAPVAAGQGYWAWFACGHNVTPAGGTAAAHLRLHLGGYHASMVGNPTTRPVTVSGFDFAARWDPALNGGAGGYHLSGYRPSQTLTTGQGIWVFSYHDATVKIDG